MQNLLGVPLDWVGNSELWNNCESELGLVLPGQFKNLIEGAGELTFGEIHVLSPFASSSHLSLREKGRQILNADSELGQANSWHYPLPLYPEMGGLLPWAISDAGEILYWITNS